MSGKLSLNNPRAAQAAALAAARAKAAEPKADALIRYTPPAECRERIRILADDSGSMSSHIPDVREGIVEYLRNSAGSAIAVHLLCIGDAQNKMSTLESNLPALAGLVKSERFGNGGTPLFSRMRDTLSASPQCTRMVVFTDGSPTDSIVEPLAWNSPERTSLMFFYQRDANVIVEKAREAKIVIDTIFFGFVHESSDEITLLKYLAEQTGGIFMLFVPGKTDFKKALKYLSPGLRGLLTDGKIKAEVESGQRD